MIEFDENYVNFANDYQMKENFVDFFRNLKSESYPDLDYYKFIFSPLDNFIICIGEKGFCIIDQNNLKEISFTKIFKNNDPRSSNILVSNYTFSNKIQLNFENKIYLFEEDRHDKKIKKIKVQDKNKKLFNKKLLKLMSDEYHFLYYDHKMNFQFTIYDFKHQNLMNYLNSSQVDIKLLNEYKENSFYCLDSALTKINNEDRLFSICGFKGESRLIKFEKSLKETNVQKFIFNLF